ncbi:MAG: dihydrodipicolinate synthase family protein [Chthoniobacterales bacterium]
MPPNIIPPSADTVITDGIWPVMLTSFLGPDQIDWAGVQALTDFYIAQGAHGLFAACLSSEALSLSPDNKVELVRRVVEFAEGRVPVVGGVLGLPDRNLRTDAAATMVAAGAKAAVIPLCDLAGETDPDEVWIEEMEANLAGLGDVPLGLYECPVPYQRFLTPALTSYLSDKPNFRFLKDTSGSIAEMQRKSEALPHLRIFSAASGNLLEALDAGMHGFSGLQTNFWPDLLVELFECHREQPARAAGIQDFLREYGWVEGRSYPASAKLLLRMAHNLPIQTLSFLNDASVSHEDQVWAADVIAAWRHIHLTHLSLS